MILSLLVIGSPGWFLASRVETEGFHCTNTSRPQRRGRCGHFPFGIERSKRTLFAYPTPLNSQSPKSASIRPNHLMQDFQWQSRCRCPALAALVFTRPTSTDPHRTSSGYMFGNPAGVVSPAMFTSSDALTMSRLLWTRTNKAGTKDVGAMEVDSVACRS